MKRILPFLLGMGVAGGCRAGWLNPSQPGFVIQTYTTYDPITGNNTGTILTNGISYQFAGDNTGTIYIGGPGTQFRGNNDGSVHVGGDGSFVLGSFASLSSATNRGKGSLLLGNLTVGQKATITDVGNASLLLGAGTVSNNQAIVVGDGMESHGSRSVTAESFWGMGSGFHGNGGGLTNLPTDLVMGGRVAAVEARTNVWNAVASGAVMKTGSVMTGALTIQSPGWTSATFGPRRAPYNQDPGWCMDGSWGDGIRLMPVVYNVTTTYLFTVSYVDEGGGYAHPRLTLYRTNQGQPVATNVIEVVGNGIVGQSILSVPGMRIGGDLDITGRASLSNFVQSIINAQ